MTFIEYLGFLMSEAALALLFAIMCGPPIIILLVYCFQHVIFFPMFYINRMRLAAKFEKICKEHDFEFYRHRSQWYYGRLRDTDCECSIVTPKARYAIKLIGIPQRHYKLYLTDQHTYAIRKPAITRLNVVMPLDYYEMPPHRFFVNDERVRENITPILLINPCPRALYWVPGHSHEMRELYNGDQAGDCTLYTLTGFLEQLRSDVGITKPEEQDS